MKDVLVRLQLALPRIRFWMRELHHYHSDTAIPIARRGFPRLPAYFPPSLLDETRSAVVDAIPFPPVIEYGVPEFGGMIARKMDGITFGDLYFVRQGCNTETLNCHELVHAIQWRALGVERFLLTYALGILERGYPDSPLEAIAYEIGRRFDTGELPRLGLVELVTQHAIEARDAAAQWFAREGLSI